MRKGRWPPVLLHSTLELFEQDKACCVAQAGLTDFMPQSLGYRYYRYVPQYLAPRLFLFCIWSISITLNSYFCQSCPGYSCLMWKRNPSFSAAITRSPSLRMRVRLAFLQSPLCSCLPFSSLVCQTEQCLCLLQLCFCQAILFILNSLTCLFMCFIKYYIYKPV